MTRHEMTPIPLVRPVVVVSQCLGFAAVRYNGAIIHDDFVQRLAQAVDVIEVCPEVAIGLGVPRDPIRMQRASSRTADTQLVQPATGRDITTAMSEYAQSFAAGLGVVDGFVLKSRSPSCGITGVSIFADHGDAVADTGPGVFAHTILRAFPSLPAEDEISLRNSATRQQFLTRVYAHARFRAARTHGGRARLIAFHTAYKYLLMAHSPDATTELGRIVARPGDEESKSFDAYDALLTRALTRVPDRGAYTNALSHMFGYVSHALSSSRRSRFVTELERFRADVNQAHETDGTRQRLELTRALREMIEEQDVLYLKSQTFFEPYPVELS